MRHPEVAEAARGTFAGLVGAPRWSTICATLGVTAVELLPVHAFVARPASDRARPAQLLGLQHDRLLRAAPRVSRHRAASARSRPSCSVMHDAGIEVILDVVYNHTAEGNQIGPDPVVPRHRQPLLLLSDRATERYYNDFTGTGNALELRHPYVLRMVTDSLRYWVEEMRVDGFRFDLATTLARDRRDRSTSMRASSTRCAQDPVLSAVKLIAEPWDTGLGGYQVGNFPPGWAEWNDQYRDTVRRFWKGDEGQLPALASRVVGLGRHLRPPRPPALGEHQFRHRPRRLHAARPGQLQRQAQRGEQGGQPRRLRQQQQLELRRRGADRRSRDPGAAPAPDAQFPGHAAAVAGRADAARRRRVRPHPGRQQQRLLPGQRDQLARLEPERTRARACSRSRAS